MAKIAVFYDHLLEIARQERIPLAQALQMARQMGIDYVEVSSHCISPGLGEELAAARLKISCIPCFFDFGRDPDPLASALPVLETAKSLGADKLLLVPGFWGEEDSLAQQEQQTENMLSAIQALVGPAAKKGITLTIEDYDSRLAPYATIKGLRRFLARCPGLALTFDTGNFRYSGEDEKAAWAALGDRVVHVHLKDRALTPAYGSEPLAAAGGERLFPCPVGQGAIPIRQLIELLKENEYFGVYTIEHYGVRNMLACLRQSIDWLRQNL